MSVLRYPRGGTLAPSRPASESVRCAAALALRSAAIALAKWSRRLAKPAPRVAHSTPRLEFYAEAGAPEGALYLDGRLIGWVRGVNRL